MLVTLKSEANESELFLIIVEDKVPDTYFKARRYFEITPKIYTEARPKRSFRVGQLVQLQYKRYPSVFRIREILRGESGDIVLVLTFNYDAVENMEDINR